MMDWFLGLDLGQSADYTALAIIRRTTPEGWRPNGAPPPDAQYDVVGLKRYVLGTRYPVIVADVRDLLSRDPLKEPRAALVVDATGVGAPVVDTFYAAGLLPTAITITGGHDVLRAAPAEWHVPKRDLVSVLQVLLQSGRFRIASRLPEAATLHRELLNFRVKITAAANDTYAAWREGDHDDTVLATALAVWAGERLNEAPARFFF